MKNKSTKKNKKQKPNYRIIRIEKQIKKYGFLNMKSYVHNKKITMVKFYAENDDEAYEYLVNYKKVANKAYDYYYDQCHSYGVADKDGKIHYYDDFEDRLDHELDSGKWYKKIYEDIVFNLKYIFIDKPKELYYWIRDNIYLLRNKHQYGEHWSLDDHILKDLIWNIDRLNKYSHGMAFPYCEMAVKETHKNDKNFDINKWNEQNHSYTEEEEKLAVKYQKESRNELVKYIKLYMFYRDCGCSDYPDIEKEYHHTLPIKKGTYDTLDYKKLHSLSLKYWNKIWEWMRMYGETLWD